MIPVVAVLGVSALLQTGDPPKPEIVEAPPAAAWYERDVFLNLQLGVPLIVATKDDIWMVKDGRIAHVSSAPRDEGVPEGPESP